MEFPNDDNGDVLRRLESKGDDLTKSRDVDFNVVFPEKRKAETFALYFKEKGYKSTVRFADVVKSHPWEVLVVKPMIPTYTGIANFEQELQRQADELDGFNDGWGCVTQNEFA